MFSLLKPVTTGRVSDFTVLKDTVTFLSLLTLKRYPFGRFDILEKMGLENTWTPKSGAMVFCYMSTVEGQSLNGPQNARGVFPVQSS